mmetsp:Transcript_14013/g.20875  ORF Transcript_14013/g.20875 Transcript_14013/m.20875 type:complete len:250 (-) Transcript_14013:808-1557(-)
MSFSLLQSCCCCSMSSLLRLRTVSGSFSDEIDFNALHSNSSLLCSSIEFVFDASGASAAVTSSTPFSTAKATSTSSILSSIAVLSCCSFSILRMRSSSSNIFPDATSSYTRNCLTAEPRIFNNSLRPARNFLFCFSTLGAFVDPPGVFNSSSGVMGKDDASTLFGVANTSILWRCGGKLKLVSSSQNDTFEPGVFVGVAFVLALAAVVVPVLSLRGVVILSTSFAASSPRNTASALLPMPSALILTTPD